MDHYYIENSLRASESIYLHICSETNIFAKKSIDRKLKPEFKVYQIKMREHQKFLISHGASESPVVSLHRELEVIEWIFG